MNHSVPNSFISLASMPQPKSPISGLGDMLFVPVIISVSGSIVHDLPLFREQFDIDEENSSNNHDRSIQAGYTTLTNALIRAGLRI